MYTMILFVLLTVLAAEMPGAAVPTAAIAVLQLQTSGLSRHMMSSSVNHDTDDIVLESVAASNQPAAVNCGKGYSAVGKLCGKQQRRCCAGSVNAVLHALAIQIIEKHC
jgi:hypothetical protein